MRKPPNILYGVDETPPIGVSVLSGLQHVGLMANFLVYPMLVAQAAGSSPEVAAALVNMTLIALAVFIADDLVLWIPGLILDVRANGGGNGVTWGTQAPWKAPCRHLAKNRAANCWIVGSAQRYSENHTGGLRPMTVVAFQFSAFQRTTSTLGDGGMKHSRSTRTPLGQVQTISRRACSITSRWRTRSPGKSGGQVQCQLADRFGTRAGPPVVAGRRALTQLAHPLRVLRPASRLDRPAVGPAFPALDAYPVGDFVNVGRLGIVAQIQPPVPDVPLAQPPDDLLARLIHAHRQIAVAQ